MNRLRMVLIIFRNPQLPSSTHPDLKTSELKIPKSQKIIIFTLIMTHQLQ